MTVTGDTEELKSIFPTSLTDAALELFTAAAIELVTVELGSSGLSAARLNSIAMFLSAHYASSADPRMKSASFDGYKYIVQGETSEGLSGTAFGQTAMSLDSTGVLVTLSKKKMKLVAYGPED